LPYGDASFSTSWLDIRPFRIGSWLPGNFFQSNTVGLACRTIAYTMSMLAATISFLKTK
jgi:hypothetical protein